MLSLQTLDDRGQLGEDFVGLLMILDLSCNELGQVAKRLRRIQDLALLADLPLEMNQIC